MHSSRGDRGRAALWLLSGLCLILGVILWVLPRSVAPEPPEPPQPEITRGDEPAAGAEGTAWIPAPTSADSQSGLPSVSETTPEVNEATPAGGSAPVVAARGTTIRRSAAAVTRGRIALVIDDAGHDLEQLEPFLDLPGAVTIAVLPGLAHSAEAARRARAAGKPVMLHSPMQPLGDEDPGPGAITSAMSDDRIRAELERQLAEVGAVEGVNNHMGSRVTADVRVMRAVLALTKHRGLVFLDSKTSAQSVVEREAKALGALSAARDVFLDNDPAPEEVRLQMEEAKRIARTRGGAVVIGHAQTKGLAAFLAAALPAMEREGYRLVRVGELSGQTAGGGR